MPGPDDEVELDDVLETFWREAVFRARLNHVPSYFGPTPLEVVRPPAWAFGTTAAEADRFVRDAAAGTTTALAGARREYAAGGEPLPEEGELGIVVDGSDRPRLLVAVTEVVSEPYAALGTGTVVEGSGFAPDTEMLVQRLRVLYSR